MLIYLVMTIFLGGFSVRAAEVVDSQSYLFNARPTPKPAAVTTSYIENIYARNQVVRRSQWADRAAQPLYDDQCYNYFNLLKKKAVSPNNNEAYLRQMQSIYKGGRIIVHHTSSDRSTPQSVLKDHIKQKWGDMGYHFYVKKDCSILEGRPLHMMGTHAGQMPAKVGECGRSRRSGYNIANDFDFKAIGIVMEGNLNNGQMRCGAKLKAFVDGLRRSLGVNRIGGHGHYHLNGTDCPGHKVKQWLKTNFNEKSALALEGVDDGTKSLSGLLRSANGPIKMSTMGNEFMKTTPFSKVAGQGRVNARTVPVNDLSGPVKCTSCAE